MFAMWPGGGGRVAIGTYKGWKLQKLYGFSGLDSLTWRMRNESREEKMGTGG